MPSLSLSRFGVVCSAFALALAARAELLVVYPGSPGAGVVSRFDAATGATLAAFGRDNEGMFALAVGAADEVFVSADILGAGLIYRFNRAGEYLGKVADVNGTDYPALTAGRDGNLYAVAAVVDAADVTVRHHGIVRFNLARGTAELFVAEGAGGMMAPRALAFGPDGSLYVADATAGVLRFDGETGEFRDVFVPVGRGGLQDAAGFAFGPDGQLYVASGQTNAVLRFAADTGAFVDAFVAPGSGGLSQARSLAFGPDGNLYASSAGPNHVLRYDGRSGQFLGAFATNPDFRGPGSLVFTPEATATVPRIGSMGSALGSRPRGEDSINVSGSARW